MRNSVSREPVRAAIAGHPKHDRTEFDALLASLRAMRRQRCAERVVPSAPDVEAA